MAFHETNLRGKIDKFWLWVVKVLKTIGICFWKLLSYYFRFFVWKYKCIRRKSKINNNTILKQATYSNYAPNILKIFLSYLKDFSIDPLKMHYNSPGRRTASHSSKANFVRWLTIHSTRCQPVIQSLYEENMTCCVWRGVAAGWLNDWLTSWLRHSGSSRHHQHIPRSVSLFAGMRCDGSVIALCVIISEASTNIPFLFIAVLFLVPALPPPRSPGHPFQVRDGWDDAGASLMDVDCRGVEHFK